MSTVFGATWMARFVGHSTAFGAAEQSPGPRDDMVIQAPHAVRRCLDGLMGSQFSVVLQGLDGEAAGTARMRSTGSQGLLLALDQGELSITPMPSLNATISGNRGLLLFTLRSPSCQPSGLLQAPWPDTIIQVQSRRHFRVSHRLDKAWLGWPGAQTHWRVHDISEEGLGIWLEPGGALPDHSDQPALLHLDDMSLPVPALHPVHGSTSERLGVRRRVGLRMVGINGEHLRQLRRWLAAHQAAGLRFRDDQV
jgi:hypothetical protein